MMIIMENLETMLSDAVNITSILNISDAKFHKFRQLKKQMSNISTPSPAGSPDPSDLIGLDSDAVSQTVLKTINNIGEADGDKMDEAEETMEDLSGDLDTPVTIGAEFFPAGSSSSLSGGSSALTSVTLSCVQTSSSQLTCLTSSSGKIRNPFLLAPLCTGNVYCFDKLSDDCYNWKLNILGETQRNLNLDSQGTVIDSFHHSWVYF